MTPRLCNAGGPDEAAIRLAVEPGFNGVTITAEPAHATTLALGKI